MITRNDLERQKQAKERQGQRMYLAIQFVELIQRLDDHLDKFLIDSSMLNQPKAAILDGLLFAIANASNRDMRTTFSASAVLLAQFRDGIGDVGLLIPDIRSFTPADLATNRLVQGNIGVRDVIDHLMGRSIELEETMFWIKRAQDANPHLRPLHKRVRDIFTGQRPYISAYHGYVDFKYDHVSHRSS